MSWLWNLAALALLGVLFAAGLAAPLGRGRVRVAARAIGVAGALAAVLAVNLVAFRHDRHFDLTREQAFTPAAETLAILRGLNQDVELTYFYQAQNPAGRAARDMVELMGRETPRLHVRTIDPDQQPALANRMGVRMYNAALLTAAGGQRVEVVTTEDREIALGLLRLLRRDSRPVCFLADHGEYDIDNFAFHTHFEGSHAHSHDAGGMAVVNMEQHGLGRLRRALDKLGYSVRRLSLATQAGRVPADCALLIDANPRTPYAPPEVAALARYLEGGGNWLLLVEPDYAITDELARLLARAGIAVGDGVVADPTSHYFTDEQMVAVEKYAPHPATLGLALSFFPGVRPLESRVAPGVKTTPLFSSSANSIVLSRDATAAASHAPAQHALGIASEGRLDANGAPFRLAVIGDADFASNSFYPYLANADLVLGLASWLRGEPLGPAMKPPVEVLPTVVLTNAQLRSIFVLCVLVLPGACAGIAAALWWRQRY